MNTVIPAEKRAAVEQALQATFNTTKLDEITALSGGLSRAIVCKIVVDGKPYVLKIDETTPASESLAIAAKAGIAPPLHYTKDAITITGFITHKPLRAVFTTPDTLLPELAKTIRAIHAMPKLQKENSLLDTVNGLIQTISPQTRSLFEDFFEYFEEIRNSYPWHDNDKVSSHNDLNPNNIISDGEKIWVLDWDAAFLNDRYVDLAIAANFFVAGPEQEQTFLQTYFDNTLSPYNSARFFIMRQITRLIYAILMFRLAQTSDPNGQFDDPELKTIDMRSIGTQLGSGKLSLASFKGQLLYGKALINTALADVRSDRFKESITTTRTSIR